MKDEKFRIDSKGHIGLNPCYPVKKLVIYPNPNAELNLRNKKEMPNMAARETKHD